MYYYVKPTFKLYSRYGCNNRILTVWIKVFKIVSL